MNNREIFAIWAPPASPWSQWAKPVLFSKIEQAAPAQLIRPFQPIEARQGVAVVVDLPREMSVAYGLTLARSGFRPVPIYNAVSGSSEVCNLTNLAGHLLQGAVVLSNLSIPADAPPAFLLDSRRMNIDLPLAPGKLDNRHLVFPQDFPSGGYLKSRKTDEVLLIFENNHLGVADDLRHVLCRWQEAGISLSHSTPDSPGRTAPLAVNKPSGFKSLLYRALAVVGLRRNSAGGFGGLVPEPSSG